MDATRRPGHVLRTSDFKLLLFEVRSQVAVLPPRMPGPTLTPSLVLRFTSTELDARQDQAATRSTRHGEPACGRPAPLSSCIGTFISQPTWRFPTAAFTAPALFAGHEPRAT